MVIQMPQVVTDYKILQLPYYSQMGINYFFLGKTAVIISPLNSLAIIFISIPKFNTHSLTSVSL